MPKTMEELKAEAARPLPCPICDRPNYNPSDHHMIPRCRGGKATLTICRDCHRALHAIFTNKQLEREYSTVEQLLTHEPFARTVAFIAKQDPGGKVNTALNKNQRRRGRNG